MGHKINPFSYRLGINQQWKSKWFPKGNLNFKDALEEDVLLRKIIRDHLKSVGYGDIEIDRRQNNIYEINIESARPGLVIGKGGKGIEDLRKKVIKGLTKLFSKRGVKNSKYTLNINIKEITKPEISAKHIVQLIAWDLEKRIPYRRTIKKYLQRVSQFREVKGVKIRVGGRLDGADIHRKDQIIYGSMPLNTLRSKIDYAEGTAFATYGTVGIKLWLYFGDILELEKNEL